MRRITSTIGVAFGALMSSSVAVAHPDHFSGRTFGWVHFLTDPFHLLLLGVAIVATLVAWRHLRGRRRRALARPDSSPS